MDRAKRIREHLTKQDRATVTELVSLLNASPATVRRDLAALENEGHLIRVHGGAMLAPDDVGERNFLSKQRSQEVEKRAIAALAAMRLPEHSILFLDSGSTTYELAKQLFKKGVYQIYTNSLPIFELGCKRNYPIQIVGGHIRPLSKAIIGADAVRWMDALWFDFAILGASGLHPRSGAYTTEGEEAAIKRKARRQAQQCYLLADSSKWAVAAAARFAEWRDIRLFISDDSLSVSARKALRRFPSLRVLTPANAKFKKGK